MSPNQPNYASFSCIHKITLVFPFACTQVIITGFKDGLFDSIIFGIYVISTVVKQHNNPQSTQVLKRIRQCCFLSGFLMVRCYAFISKRLFHAPLTMISLHCRCLCSYLMESSKVSIGPSRKCLAPMTLALHGLGLSPHWLISFLPFGCYLWSFLVESSQPFGFKYELYQMIIINFNSQIMKIKYSSTIGYRRLFLSRTSTAIQKHLCTHCRYSF